MTAEPAEPATHDEHPSWCVRSYCTANRRRSGAHRSRPIIVNERPLLVTANLYAVASLPDDVMVEVRGVPVLLPARVAHNLGRVLTSLGNAGDEQ